jgi:hypothetical protein
MPKYNTNNIYIVDMNRAGHVILMNEGVFNRQSSEYKINNLGDMNTY